MAELNFDKLCENVANQILDHAEYYGRTFREWLDILAKYVAEQEKAPQEKCLFIYDAKKEIFIPLRQEGHTSGHWIGTEYDGEADGYPVFYAWECSACGHEHRGEVDTLTNYCPDCGARMEFFEGEAT